MHKLLNFQASIMGCHAVNAFSFAVLLLINAEALAGAARPFPQHWGYTAGTLRPTHRTAEDLDPPVRAFYAVWKSRYLATPAGAPDQRFVNYNLEGKAHAGRDPRSVSEGHGYGMLATVLMEDGAPNSTAQRDFDALYLFFRAHPSHFTPDLMAYLQTGPKLVSTDGNDSASDGDLDIAYALLLADAQWGSGGAIAYRREALKVIAAVQAHEVNRAQWTIKLGDFAEDGTEFATGTRTSDFTLQHWKSFQKATGDADWERLRAHTYEILASVCARSAPKTGLMPDFLVFKKDHYEPPAGRYLESKHDGDWSYNACRTPWRVATDYLINGDARALPQLRTLNAWIRSETGGDPRRINAGYTLAGVPIGSRLAHGQRINSDDNGSCFYAPLAVSAMVSPDAQPWLDSLWSLLLSRQAGSGDEDDDYYSSSVKLLCLITISGNWWAP